MPPFADTQGDVVFSINAVLAPWLKRNRRFLGATNEVGMLLAGSVRAADAALWRREDLSEHLRGTLRRVPPVLAVEVAGQDEDQETLSQKARWYLDHGVLVVWLVFPDSRSVQVVTHEATSRHTQREVLPSHAALPGLAPRVRLFFDQLPRLPRRG